MIRAAIAALVLAAPATPLVAGQLTALAGELSKKWPDNRTINIVFHGHSVPAGYQKTPEVRPFEAYPHLFTVALKQSYPFAVENTIVTAIGGENSIAGAARFERDVLRHKPDLVVIDYALNDRGQDPNEVEAAWRSMIITAKGESIPLVLCTPTGDLREDLSDPRNPLPRLADMIRRIAREENVLLADVSAAWLAVLASGTPAKNLHSQPNHPNLKGNRIAADALFSCFNAATAP